MDGWMTMDYSEEQYELKRERTIEYFFHHD